MPRELVFDTDFAELFRAGRDEDAVVLLKGARASVIVQLPATTAVGRCIVVVDAANIERTLRARTADWGADNLRAFPPMQLGPGARARFVFRPEGYWKHEPADA